MNNSSHSAVLAFAPAAPVDMVQAMHDKLCYYTDAWDLAQDLASGVDTIVVIDTRSLAHYGAGHIPGAVSFPHRDMTPDGCGC